MVGGAKSWLRRLTYRWAVKKAAQAIGLGPFLRTAYYRYFRPKEAYAHLLDNIRLNELENVRTYCRALGEHRGGGKLYRGRENADWSLLKPPTGCDLGYRPSGDPEEAVPDFLRSLGFDHIDVYPRYDTFHLIAEKASI
jgi:hypothetical protein